MPSRITSLIPQEVSHVDKGANGRPYFLVKSDDGKNSEMDFQGILALAKAGNLTQEIVADFLVAAKNISTEQAAELTLAVKAKEQTVPQLFDVSKVVKADGSFNPEAVIESVRPLAQQLIDAKVVATNGNVDLEKADKALHSIIKAVAGSVLVKEAPKATPDLEALTKAQADLTTKLAKAETDLAAERVIRLRKEFEETAKAKFSGVGAAGEVGAFLLKCSTQLDKETYVELEKFFGVAQTKIEKSALFGEMGSSAASAGANGSAYQQLEKAADEVQKAEPKLSKEQAFAKAVARHPDLYKQYLNDRNAA